MVVERIIGTCWKKRKVGILGEYYIFYHSTLGFFPTLSNSAFETEFGSVHNGVPFRPQWSESKYTDMNRKMLSL